MSNSFTFEFKNLLPNFDAFKTLLSEIPFDYNALDEGIVMRAYYLLYRRYGLSNVRYTTPEAFYNQFSIILDDELDRYIRRYKLIQKSIEITDDDLIEFNKMVQNYANNPNTKPDNPLDPLEYVTSQNYSVQFSNKLEAYVNAINNMPSNYSEAFLDKFKDLFINIIPQNIPIYTKGE